jgi:hypothetical protein
MTSPSPREDLCILAAVTNNPKSSWAAISEEILHKYYEFVPPEVCEDRYESFLRFITPIQEVKELVPYRLKNL